MPKKRKSSSSKMSMPVACGIGESPPSSPLKKQSPYDRKPWQPGEVPAAPFMRVLRPLDAKATPYGQGQMGVEKPTARGKVRGHVEAAEGGVKP